MQPSGGMQPPYGGYPGPMYPVWAAPAPPPMPRPRGIPSRTLFLVGAIGHFFSAGMAIPSAVFSLGIGFSFFFGGLGTVLFLVVAGIATAGTVLLLIGFFGLWRNYGSQLALGTFVFGLIAVGYSVAATVFFFTVGLPGGFPSFFTGIVLLGAPILFGVLFILEGCVYIVNRHFLLPGPAIAAAVLFIIAGGFVCSILLDFVGTIVSMPALIIGGVLLTRAPIPMAYPGMSEPVPAAPPGPPYFP